MQETRVLVETKGTTGEETISYWFDLPIDVAEFEEKLGVGAESGDYRIIEKVLPYADEVHEHTSVYQLNKNESSQTDAKQIPRIHISEKRWRVESKTYQ